MPVWGIALAVVNAVKGSSPMSNGPWSKFFPLANQLGVCHTFLCGDTALSRLAEMIWRACLCGSGVERVRHWCRIKERHEQVLLFGWDAGLCCCRHANGICLATLILQEPAERCRSTALDG
ncbi:MAG: hypothetical protein M2R45_02362 [Verrucomicrobia subdivision 3 bacterium]|nr:hypothetical protein [Limisphaerales bacterium]MCS1414913.1 hypothetical protein [Limisphaerales bacterium]